MSSVVTTDYSRQVAEMQAILPFKGDKEFYTGLVASAKKIQKEVEGEYLTSRQVSEKDVEAMLRGFYKFGFESSAIADKVHKFFTDFSEK